VSVRDLEYPVRGSRPSAGPVREYVKAKIVANLRRHDQTIPIIAASRGTNRAVVDAILRLALFAYMPKLVDRLPSSA